MTDDRAARLAGIEKRARDAKPEDSWQVLRVDIPWLQSELSRLEYDLQIECEVRAGYYEEIKTLERSLAEAKEREAALRKEIGRVIEEFSRAKGRWLKTEGALELKISEARNKALEDAAKLCTNHGDAYLSHETRVDETAYELAQAIRALRTDRGEG